MEVDVLQENLAKAVTLLSRATPPRSSLPILGDLLLATDKGRLAISASDLELYATIHVGAQVKTEGAVTLPAKMMAKMVTKLPNERLTIDANERHATISQEGRTLSLEGNSAEDFPPPPKHGDIIGTLDPKLFLSTLARVSFCAGNDDARPAIQGIHLKAEGDQLTMTATDGFHLASFHMDYEGKPFTTLIPAYSFAKFTKLLKALMKDSDELHVAESEHSLHLEHGNLSVTMQPIKATFPDYTQLIPDGYDSRIRVLREALLSELGVCMALVKDGTGIIRLQHDGDELSVSAKTMGEGSYEATIPATIEGATTRIAFNGTYLTNILSAMTEEIVTIDLKGPSRPGLIHDSEAGVYVVMPMTVEW